jgi:hypothetical protein
MYTSAFSSPELDETAKKFLPRATKVWFRRRARQGCQIFLDAAHQDEEKLTKTLENIANGYKIYQMAGKLTKWPQNIPTSFVTRHS